MGRGDGEEGREMWVEYRREEGGRGGEMGWGGRRWEEEEGRWGGEGEKRRGGQVGR